MEGKSKAGKTRKPPAKKPGKAQKTPTAKKRPSGKMAAGDSAAETLSGELCGLIPQLDEEGLRFLIQQARVHLYNMQVEALNQNIIREQAAAKPKKAPPAKAGLGIRAGESRESYYLSYGNDWVMLTDDEMLVLAKIASGPGSELERAERLCRWLENERGDVFAVVPIADKFSPVLKDLLKLLRKTFKVRYG